MKLIEMSNSLTGDSSFHGNVRTVAKGAGVVFAGTLAGSGLRYALQVIIARGLGVELFGIFVLALTIFKILVMLSEMGLPNGVVRFVAVYRGMNDPGRIKGIISDSLRISLPVSLAIGTFIFLFSAVLAEKVFRKPGLSMALKIFAFAVPFTTVTSMLIYAVQGFKILKYKMIVREIFEPLSRLVLVSLILAAGWKLGGVLLVYLVVSIMVSGLAFHYLRRVFPRIGHKEIVPVFETRKLFSFSWPLLFVFFFGILMTWMDTVMLALFRPSADVGLYGAALRTAWLCSIIMTAFHSAFVPISADLHNRGKTHELSSLFKTVSKWNLLVSFPLCFWFMFYGTEILGIFGPSFGAGAEILAVLSLSWLVHSAMSSAGIILTTSGKTKMQLLNVSILLMLNIILNYLLIPPLGGFGAALATAVSILLFDVISVIEVAVILNMIPFRVDFLKILLAGGGSVSFLVLMRLIIFPGTASLIMVFAAGLIFTLLYAGIIFLLGISTEERMVFREIFKRLKRTGNSAA